LAGKVGQERFDLWFGESVELRPTSESLLVAAADQFTLDRLRSQFLTDLTSAAASVLGDHSVVEFVLDESLAFSSNASNSESTEQATGRGFPRVHTTGANGQGARRRFARFREFVVGGSNRVAHTAAQMVVERPGCMSPLFLYGPSGSGKSHLLESIWSAARNEPGRQRVLYLTAEQFTSMFLEALRGSGLPSFRHKYRYVDALLIDDVQFFAGKKATLVEFQSTIDALLREQRQLVLAADRPPAELSGFGPELTTRLTGGLVCSLEGADMETRLGILRHFARRMEVHFPADVLQMLAERLSGDARQLAGALNQLEATSRAFGQAIDLQLAYSALADVFRATQRVVQLDDIDRAVCDVFGLEPQTLQSPRKARTISQPRALAMWLARKHTRAAYSEIGEYFGHRSHSTVISAQKQVHRWMDGQCAVRLSHGDCDVREAIRRVESHLRTG
jgi:chromosomal replication initiator protein